MYHSREAEFPNTYPRQVRALSELRKIVNRPVTPGGGIFFRESSSPSLSQLRRTQDIVVVREDKFCCELVLPRKSFEKLSSNRDSYEYHIDHLRASSNSFGDLFSIQGIAAINFEVPLSETEYPLHAVAVGQPKDPLILQALLDHHGVDIDLNENQASEQVISGSLLSWFTFFLPRYPVAQTPFGMFVLVQIERDDQELKYAVAHVVTRSMSRQRENTRQANSLSSDVMRNLLRPQGVCLDWKPIEEREKIYYLRGSTTNTDFYRHQWIIRNSPEDDFPEEEGESSLSYISFIGAAETEFSEDRVEEILEEKGITQERQTQAMTSEHADLVRQGYQRIYDIGPRLKEAERENAHKPAKESFGDESAPTFTRPALERHNNHLVVAKNGMFWYYKLRCERLKDKSPHNDLLKMKQRPAIACDGIVVLWNKLYRVTTVDILRGRVNLSNRIIQDDEHNYQTGPSTDETIESSADEPGLSDSDWDELSKEADMALEEQERELQNTQDS